PVAVVNGDPIERDALVEALIENFGGATLEQLIKEKLVAQEAARRKIAWTQAEFDGRLRREVEARLKNMARRFGVNSVAALQDQMQRANQSFEALRREVERKARPLVATGILLEKMAAADIKVTKDEVRREFTRRYGPKAIVRQIVLAGRADAEEVLNRLKAGAEFTALVRERSIDTVSRERGGQMAPLPGHGVLGSAAFQLKPGEISGILKTDDGYHLLRLDRTQPAADVKFEQMSESLHAELKGQRAARRVPELLQDLLGRAEIKRMLGGGD
ncbi:MAG: hypothetical protein GY844_28390, partial [Bradyrhizobium sp.]|nr:hypothetical protein [Bradyrhizobium sp.]